MPVPLHMYRNAPYALLTLTTYTSDYGFWSVFWKEHLARDKTWKPTPVELSPALWNGNTVTAVLRPPRPKTVYSSHIHQEIPQREMVHCTVCVSQDVKPSQAIAKHDTMSEEHRL
jgi:hypothetical protein